MIQNKNIICNGYFQKSDFFVPFRKELISLISNENNNDYWMKDIRKFYPREILFLSKHSIENLSENDIVINLRLDDFIQMPNPKSDILPPQYYLNILDGFSVAHEGKIYIVCDTIRHYWENRYLDFFNKYNPILIQKPLEHDIALLRDANVLIHSNSTLCWIASFFSTLPNKRRFIPKTFHYSGQDLREIVPETDVLFLVKTLEHHDVFNIHCEEYNREFIHPLPYCIPDDCILSKEQHENILKEKRKINLVSNIVPNGTRQYHFGHSEEKEYNLEYRNSWFAHTQKKGGWDCLRHYEIMANGCIPLFENLENCPKYTLTGFPKELVLKTNKLFANLPSNSYSIEYEEMIKDHSFFILNYAREHCSTSSVAKYFMEVLEKHEKDSLEKYYFKDSLKHNLSPIKPKKNILLVRCNIGVNYTRELLWIGIKQYYPFTEKGVIAEYPKIDYLYKSFPEENKKHLYGNGFSYSKKIELILII